MHRDGKQEHAGGVALRALLAENRRARAVQDKLEEAAFAHKSC